MVIFMKEKVLILSCGDCSLKKTVAVDMKQDNSDKLARFDLEKKKQEHMEEYGHLNAQIESFTRQKDVEAKSELEKAMENKRQAEKSRKRREKNYQRETF